MENRNVRLGVNIDHIATIREARKTTEPDPVAAAVLAELAGADGITIHIRGDRRHIQDRDVRMLRETVKTRLNVEMAATTDMIKFITSIKPDTATLVPERREEITTEGGLDVALNAAHIQRTVTLLQDAGVTVSLFIDPDLDQIKAAQKAGSSKIEINTGKFADATHSGPGKLGMGKGAQRRAAGKEAWLPGFCWTRIELCKCVAHRRNR